MFDLLSDRPSTGHNATAPDALFLAQQIPVGPMTADPLGLFYRNSPYVRSVEHALALAPTLSGEQRADAIALAIRVVRQGLDMKTPFPAGARVRLADAKSRPRIVIGSKPQGYLEDHWFGALSRTRDPWTSAVLITAALDPKDSPWSQAPAEHYIAV